MRCHWRWPKCRVSRYWLVVFALLAFIINCYLLVSVRQHHTPPSAAFPMKHQLIQAIIAKTMTTRTQPRPTVRHPSVTKPPTIACHPAPRPQPLHHQLLPCNWRTANISCSHRLQAFFHCNKSSASIVEKWIPTGTPPVTVSFNDSCLLRVVQDRCSRKNGAVPNAVHYVEFSIKGQTGRQLPIYTFLGLVSVLRFLQPCLLLFHANHLPHGPLWNKLLQMTPRVVHVKRNVPDSVFGNEIVKIEHKADVARLEAMIRFGGVYMDTDEVILKSMDDLMGHQMTLAWERINQTFGNGMFLASPDNTFLKLWYDKYRSFTNRWWSYFSTRVPQLLYRQHPEMDIRVVDTFFKPHLWNITNMFYKNKYDWSDHYALHLYYRRNAVYFRGDFEKKKNSSLGEISRHVLFGDINRCLT